MKRLLLFLSLCFVCSAAIAHTINWYVDGSIYHTTTCESGDDVTPPTAPEKYGYTFKGWNTHYGIIEYLESTGTQWIDTEWFFSKNYSDFEISVTFSDSGVQPDIWAVISGVNLGASGEKQYYLVQYDQSSINSIVVHNSDNNLSQTFTVEEGGKHNFVMQYKNGVTTITNGSDTKYLSDDIQYRGEHSLYLFAAHGPSGAIQFSKIKMYSFSIKVDGVLVHDFVPVLDMEGIPCMYDKISGQFYYNAGTGDFIAGPIIGE